VRYQSRYQELNTLKLLLASELKAVNGNQSAPLIDAHLQAMSTKGGLYRVYLHPEDFKKGKHRGSNRGNRRRQEESAAL
jgi:hypothetical protein